MGYVCVLGTLLGTVYGQLILKWKVGQAGPLPHGWSERFDYLLKLSLNPFVISVFVVAAVAALMWMVALTRFDLSRAYPFMSLTFVLIPVGSLVLFGEEISSWQIGGIGLIVCGLIVASQG